MSFRLRLKYYLVHELNYASKKAAELIAAAKIKINGKIIYENVIIGDRDEIKLGEKVIKKEIKFRYYKLNKPVGIESTFHKKIKHNLSSVFPFDESFFIAGRLDKYSEGLLLISNDGKWVNEISNSKSNKEKEYEVEVEKIIDNIFLKKMRRGVDIGFYKTKPCGIKKMGKNKFSIILTEGKNKQIKRMCKKLGNKVISLKRVRIDEFYLTELQVNTFKGIIM